MLLLVERRIRGERCRSINKYTNANNEYMKDYDKT